MVPVTIVHGDYKQTSNWRAPSCATFTIMFLSKLTNHWDENLLFLAKKKRENLAYWSIIFCSFQLRSHGPSYTSYKH